MLFAVPLRRAASLAALAASLLVAGCGGGGGGGGGGNALAVRGDLLPSNALANQCTVSDQQRWIRSYLDETYLWYDEIREVDASQHGTVQSYFDALLVSTPDATGQPKDRFSFSMSASSADIMQGLATGAGAQAEVAADPTVASAASPSTVPLVKTLLSGNGRKVGYILFNDHSRGAQDALITAFKTLKTAAVQDLVLDLRYNPGGFLYIAQSAAAMVAGPGIQGRVFESLRYNNKRTADTAGSTFIFSTQVRYGESTYPAGHPLPQLSLPRVYVLTSELTCSASESIINSLRGIGVQVILVGDRTCGKPYGFHRMDNCGRAFFPIEFQVFNAVGFGDYQDGFPVQCRVAENPSTALGAANEPLLAAALRHIETGSCPTVTVGGAVGVVAQPVAVAGPSPLDRPGAPKADAPMYQPGWDGRRLIP